MQLALSPNAPNIKTSADGKAFRRALRAFGLTAIRDALGAGQSVSDRLAESRQPALFNVTAENVDQAIAWAAIPRHPSLEMDAGEAFDLLELLRADPASWTPPADVPAYDPALEDWRPEPKPEDVDEVAALDLLGLLVDEPFKDTGIAWGEREHARAQQLVERHRKRTTSPAS